MYNGCIGAALTREITDWNEMVNVVVALFMGVCINGVYQPITRSIRNVAMTLFTGCANVTLHDSVTFGMHCVE